MLKYVENMLKYVKKYVKNMLKFQTEEYFFTVKNSTVLVYSLAENIPCEDLRI